MPEFSSAAGKFATAVAAVADREAIMDVLASSAGRVAFVGVLGLILLGNDKLYMKSRDVAEMLGVSMATVLDWAEAKKIPCYKVGGRWIFLRSEIEAWIASQSNGNVHCTLNGNGPASGGTPRGRDIEGVSSDAKPRLRPVHD
jgi:excisionase family DNA binding protein